VSEKEYKPTEELNDILLKYKLRKFLLYVWHKNKKFLLLIIYS